MPMPMQGGGGGMPPGGMPPGGGMPGFAKGTDALGRHGKFAAKPSTMSNAHGMKGNDGTHYGG